LATNRYEKYSVENLRENPRDEMEEQLAEDEAQQLAEQIMSRLGSGPNFRRRVVRKIAERELNSAKREVARLQGSLDDGSL
jgi:hypothetical protein